MTSSENDANRSIINSMKNLTNPIIISIAIFELSLTFLVSYIEPYKSFNLSLRLNFYFTANLALFAIIEGASTYLQWVQSNKRNQIEDARNELEVAYGPLYSILKTMEVESVHERKINGELIECFNIMPDKKEILDNILSRYPFMFPLQIHDYWKKYIQTLNPTVAVFYSIPLTFCKSISEEYEKRVRRYNELLRK